MSIFQRTPHAMQGLIRRRLLVNAIVDPDEAALHLPTGLRPHVSEAGTVVGCCLLDLVQVRPARLPRVSGWSFRAVAHRISVEWDCGTNEPSVGVYVPTRHTNSLAVTVAGGRLFPGVHHPANVRMTEHNGRLEWSVAPRARADEYAITVAVACRSDAPTATCEPVGGTCLSATVGLSPGHDGVLEGARMEPAHRRAQRVDVERLDSPFLASFASAVPAPSYLMRDVDVIWTPARPSPTFSQSGDGDLLSPISPG